MFDDQIGISRIEVKLDSTRSGQHKVLYANGRMQVRVLVLLHGIDNNGDGASLYGHPGLQSLRLIAYNGARPLDGDWSVSLQENRYAHEMSGGETRLTEVPRSTDHRISDPSDPVQIFQFWVSASRPGIMDVAAEISMDGVVLRSNGIGFDSSVTLEAIPPKKYTRSSFSLHKYGTFTERVYEERIQYFHLGLHADGRQINLLDWYSNTIALNPYDAEDAVMVYSSGTINHNSGGGRSFYGYLAPIYGRSASVKTPLGYITFPLNDVPGVLTLVQRTTLQTEEKPGSDGAFELAVIDEFGSEHWLAIDGDIERRTFILGESKRSTKQFS
ncbi:MULTISPECIES: hypothetical protein [unclassified Pseudomonas]|uniref:hypothetical protein n=1 Tax=unclassified Pseudomonas TaxID=196821 RepID=UPI00215B9DFA|nr:MULTISPECIES: hypothetical protein [unclassified Pseudomonas]MCR8933417.1 hypothetical protein [Pseudomonas sp. S11A4]MCR8977021.1 hypothetical protein [Pseudomonas sp. S11P7]